MKKVDENDQPVVCKQIVEVLFKGLSCVFRVSLDINVRLDPFLLPVQRHTASNLHKGVNDVSVSEEQFRLYEVGHVAVII